MSQKKATRRKAVGKKAPRKKATASQEIHKDLEVIAFSTDKRWLSWIAKNYEREAGIWLKFAKKGSGIKTVTYEQAREGAIIYGWIDGLINKYDEQYYLVRFTPRRPRSKWSKINREIAEQLIKTKKMQPSGLAQVKAAKADGRWAAAYDSPANIKVPPELEKLLSRSKKARQFFESISAANRYAFLYRIYDAKRAATREKRIEQTMAMLKKGEVFHPGRKAGN